MLGMASLEIAHEVIGGVVVEVQAEEVRGVVGDEAAESVEPVNAFLGVGDGGSDEFGTRLGTELGQIAVPGVGGGLRRDAGAFRFVEGVDVSVGVVACEVLDPAPLLAASLRLGNVSDCGLETILVSQLLRNPVVEVRGLP